MSNIEGLSGEQKLRKQCLLWAFETRSLCKVAHMEVTNVAQEYFDWITLGENQRSRIEETGLHQESPIVLNVS
ncbi:MAG: hypothetical protein AAGI12_15580 [Pseudomonadota bacterium]